MPKACARCTRRISPLCGLYTTASGGPLASTHFGSGEPDGGAAEACVSFDDRAWADGVCELEKPFVCWTPPN